MAELPDGPDARQGVPRCRHADVCRATQGGQAGRVTPGIVADPDETRGGFSLAVTAYAQEKYLPIGGAVDVAFIGRTAYALVTVVGPDVGGHAMVGIYRVDGPNSFTVVADIGAWAVAHPPATGRSSSRPGSSTRWSRTEAGSWSPTGTTTACCGSRSTARSAS